ncbi:S-adenosyl-L-homocysteine hydrolase [Rickettsiales bacterium Ac37b]|nr:S-adenosyl-L-homocysteine hydrolase [Rickettsiales bacterium Ac37b]
MIKYENIYVRLPLLEYVANLMYKTNLENIHIIACQHVLPSTHLMLRSMFDLGLKPENCAVIGKCYSTSNLVIKHMRQEGIYVDNSSNYFDSHLSFDEQFQHNIHHFLREQITRMNLGKNDKVIIMDDGGELLLAANNLLSEYSNIYGVEQTSSGYNKLKNKELHFPVMNVARSKAKLNIESPMIIESSLNQLTNHLNELKLFPTTCLIVGNGILGSCLSKSLSLKYKVKCYDTITTLSDLEPTELNLSDYDLIIGTTGEVAISSSIYHLLKKGVILASISSSDREFDAVHLRKLLQPTNNCHNNVIVNNMYLLNSGFPINFYATEKDNIPLHNIQLTFALLLAGVCQVLNNDNLGFVRLEESLQNNITKKYIKLNNR